MITRSYDFPDEVVDRDVIYTKISGDDPPSNKTEESVILRRSGYYRGETTPDFYKLQDEGQLIPFTNYERWDYREDRPLGTYRGTYRSATKEYSYATNPSRPCDGTSDTLEKVRDVTERMSGEINIELLRQQSLADLSPDLDLFTMYLERAKTFSMVTGVASRTYDLIRQAKKGKFHTVQAVSSAWLEWRYGWRTLGYDIQDTMAVYNRPYRGPIVSGQSGRTITETEIYTASDQNYYVNYDRETKIERELSVRARAAARYLGETPNVQVNPLVTAWEITPFSFVADWFISVGDSMKALSNMILAKELTFSVGYQLKETASMNVQNTSIGTGLHASSPYSATGHASSVSEYRKRDHVRAPTLKPVLHNGLDTNKLLDLAALVIQGAKSVR